MEDKTEQGDEHRYGKLIKLMYGTRAAAHDCQAEVTRTMKDLGFKQGNASPCVFWHRQRERDIKALVHGDDFVSSGEQAELEWLCKGLKNKYETTMTMVREDDDMAKEARTCEAVPRHAEVIRRDAGAEKLKTITTPASKETRRETEEKERQDLDERRSS